jgi:hypothetical protein
MMAQLLFGMVYVEGPSTEERLGDVTTPAGA